MGVLAAESAPPLETIKLIYRKESRGYTSITMGRKISTPSKQEDVILTLEITRDFIANDGSLRISSTLPKLDYTYELKESLDFNRIKNLLESIIKGKIINPEVPNGLNTIVFPNIIPAEDNALGSKLVINALSFAVRNDHLQCELELRKNHHSEEIFSFGFVSFLKEGFFATEITSSGANKARIKLEKFDYIPETNYLMTFVANDTVSNLILNLDYDKLKHFISNLTSAKELELDEEAIRWNIQLNEKLKILSKYLKSKAEVKFVRPRRQNRSQFPFRVDHIGLYVAELFNDYCYAIFNKSRAYNEHLRYPRQIASLCELPGYPNVQIVKIKHVQEKTVTLGEFIKNTINVILNYKPSEETKLLKEVLNV